MEQENSLDREPGKVCFPFISAQLHLMICVWIWQTLPVVNIISATTNT